MMLGMDTGIPYTVRIKAKIPGYDYGKSTV
jgi:hypothetical protein